MSASTWTLVDDVLGEMPLVDDLTNGGVVVTGYDVGLAKPRDAIAKKPGRSGTFDTTGLYDSRIVQLDIAYTGTVGQRQVNMERLRGFLHPGRRPSLFWQSDGLGVREAIVRGGTPTASFVVSGPPRERIQLIVPDGVWRDPLVITDELFPGQLAAGGRTYPLRYPRTYPPAQPPGQRRVTLASTADVEPVVTIYGPCTGAKYRNVTTGAFVELPGYVLSSVDRIVIDAPNRSITLDGTTSLMPQVALTTLVWPLLRHGVNDCRFEPASSSTPSVARLTYQETYL